MTKNPNRDDPSSAPESGTDRNETTGNQPAAPDKRQGKRAGEKRSSQSARSQASKPAAVGRNDDDASTAGEEP